MAGTVEVARRVFGSISAAIVAARSVAEMPVVVPWRKSTLTVKAVRCASVLATTMRGRSSASARSGTSGTQKTPEV